jgi:hypothetical protein
MEKAQEQNNEKESKVTGAIDSTLESVDTKIEALNKRVETIIEPGRKSFIRRFPGLFALIIVFGIATTFYAFERLISYFPFLNNNPILILIIGLVTLYLSGKAVKDII